jgi:voltage-gated potassium channel
MSVSPSETLRYRLNQLYYGKSRASARFRIGYIIVDLAIIAFFVAVPLLEKTPLFFVLDYAIATLLAADLAARSYASGDLRRLTTSPIFWIDLVVLLTLLLPQYLLNFGFLRALRLWTLVHSDIFWRVVWRGRYDDTYVEDVTRAAVTLITFIFVVTGFVYTSFVGHEGLNGYVDALYFTMSTLTTTGYGDITLPGTWGRLLSIATMLAGITLFLRLGQTVVRPRKVRFPCPTCGLQRHDVDAVHCKACGEQLKIPNDEE